MKYPPAWTSYKYLDRKTKSGYFKWSAHWRMIWHIWSCLMHIHDLFDIFGHVSCILMTCLYFEKVTHYVVKEVSDLLRARRATAWVKETVECTFIQVWWVCAGRGKHEGSKDAFRVPTISSSDINQGLYLMHVISHDQYCRKHYQRLALLDVDRWNRWNSERSLKQNL